MNCPIQRSIVVPCITSHLPCHPELKGTCFNVICQPFWADLGRTCNTLELSFLDSAGNWLPAPWLPNRTSLLGTSSRHKNHSQVLDGVWWAGDACAWPCLLSLGWVCIPRLQKSSAGQRGWAHCRAEPGTVCFPLCCQAKSSAHTGTDLQRAGSQDQNSLPFPEARTSLPVLPLIIAEMERSSRELCRDLGACAHVWVIY